MRPVLAVALCAALAPCALGNDLRHFEDAPLHAVQFVDAREGWAVGDEGVVWHTIDGGRTWERQPTGVRASLRSLHFLNPYTGWAAGREELPGGGSTGVLLYTRDGGVKWQRVTLNALPGLNRVRFLDHRTGFAAGDGSDQHPSGVFVTTDSGRTWQPLPGQRATTWLGADFLDRETGTLGGAWNRLASVRADGVAAVDEDLLGGRSLRGVTLTARLGLAVAEGGLVLVNGDPGKPKWEFADLKLPTEVRASWDFHAVACTGPHVWVAGRPGSVLLHSGNRGASWEIVPTKQPLPLNGIFFLDEQHGWAVGELGSVLATADGGKTWQVQRRGGERAAVLFVHARPGGLPLETIAGLGGEEGYLAVGLRVVGPDPATAAPARATESQRFAAAVRLAGGAAGEALWQFPLPQHLGQSDKAELIAGWDRRHGGRAADELLRQLVLALRVWRPEVVVTDGSASPAEALVGEAVRAAFQRAADPKAFPEQVEHLALQPWRAAKLYARHEERGKGPVVFDAGEPVRRLQASPRDFAEPAAALLSDAPARLPGQRCYALVESRLDGAERHRELMAGVALARGGEARRALEEVPELSPDLLKAIHSRRNLHALSEQPPSGLAEAEKLLAQVAPALEAMPQEHGALAAFALAHQFARAGQWSLAREVFGLMLDRYPVHPLSAEACRWLIRHSAGSEARRRQELGHFLLLQTIKFDGKLREREDKMPAADSEPAVRPTGRATGPLRFEVKSGEPQVTVEVSREGGVMQNRTEARRWYETCLALEKRLAEFGPVYVNDPSVQFCLHTARRNLGDYDGSRKWFASFAARQPPGPWRDAALAELWLVNRDGPPPKPLVYCRQTDARPFLDGRLDDRCWQAIKPVTLRTAAQRKGSATHAEDTTGDSPTEVYLAYDRDYLYVGLRCQLPAQKHVAAVKVRPRDADLSGHDRVSLMLDLDRDYSTYFHIQIDQRGCVREEFCQDGHRDRGWDPRCFVACHSEPGFWQVEAALPLAELTGEPVTLGKTWACNVVRVLPGRGVQALALPADAEPRPEGMGLMTFAADQRQAAGTAMPRATDAASPR